MERWIARERLISRSRASYWDGSQLDLARDVTAVFHALAVLWLHLMHKQWKRMIRLEQTNTLRWHC